MRGQATGYAFTSPVSSYVDAGAALAAFVIARFSKVGDTVWDLCSKRPLLALPMAVVGTNRFYVVIAAEAADYTLMVDIMLSVNFLVQDCNLFDHPLGQWNGGNPAALAVRLTPVVHP